MARIGDDLDDVAVAQPRTQGHHLAVHARADALMADIGVNRVREIDGRRPAGKPLHLPLRGEDVHLFGIQVDFQVLDELVRVAHFLLDFQELPKPLEVPFVAMIADASFLVFPMGGDALLRVAVHLLGANLYLERHTALADHRRVQRLIAVRPGHGDEVLDAPRHGRPRLVDDAEGGIAVLHAVGDDAQGHEIVDLVELDSLAFELLVDAVETLEAPIHLLHRDLGLAQLRGDGLLQVVDFELSRLPLALHFRRECLIPGRVEIFERQLLELVLNLAHTEPVRDWRVNVEGFLRGPDLPILGHMRQGAHVMQPVGQLDEDDADVVDHRQQHLAEVLGLPLFARREGYRADFGHPLDDVGHFGAKVLLDLLNGRQGVLDDVVEQAGGNGDRVEPHFGQNAGHLERVHQIGLPRMPDLTLMFEGGKHVGPAKELPFLVRGIRPHLLEKVFEPDHAVVGPMPSFLRTKVPETVSNLQYRQTFRTF